VHDGYTCPQVLNGVVIDKKRFAEKAKEAREKRMENNRSFSIFGFDEMSEKKMDLERKDGIWKV
jgi:hypothetical protein